MLAPCVVSFLIVTGVPKMMSNESPCSANGRLANKGLGNRSENLALPENAYTRLRTRRIKVAREARFQAARYSKSAIQSHKGFRSSTSSGNRRASLSRSMACRSRAFASSVRPVRVELTSENSTAAGSDTQMALPIRIRFSWVAAVKIRFIIRSLPDAELKVNTFGAHPFQHWVKRENHKSLPEWNVRRAGAAGQFPS